MNKKRIIYTLAFLTFTGMISCKKSLTELYQNPDAFTSTAIEYLLPQGIQNSVPLQYVDGSNRVLAQFAPMMQLLGNTNADPNNLYQFIQTNTASSGGAIDFGRWQYYYNTSMIQLKLIEAIYNWKLTPEEQVGYKVYYEMAKVMDAYNTAQTSDLFGDMPYSQAFTIHNDLFKQPVILQPKFDTQQSIYDSILKDLKTAALFFDTTHLQSGLTIHSILPHQDILFKGDLSKWSSLANSLRLRCAMRISAADPSRAKAEITDIVNNKRPLILDNSNNAVIYNDAQTNDYFLRSVQDNNAKQTYLSEFVSNTMQAAGDPRLRMMYYTDTSNHGVYKPLPVSKGERTETGDIKGAYAYLNPLVWGYNYAMPVGIMIDAPEVNFYLAEAAKKGWISGGDASAKNYYDAGVTQSIFFYYSLFQTAPTTQDVGTGSKLYTYIKDTGVHAPTVEGINLLLDTSNYAYNPSKAMSQIALQKYLHTGFYQIDETFAEFRRLKFIPTLLPDMLNGKQMNTSYPVRLPYPLGSSEANNNEANFNAAIAATNNNSYAFPVWWDK